MEAEEKEQIVRYRSLCSHMKAFRESRLETFESIMDALQVTRELLLLNPDFTTAWNLRRKALSTMVQDKVSTIVKELDFSVQTIKTNPKSYGAWFHRKWLIETLAANEEEHRGVPDINRELLLCGKLLDLDSRNCTSFNLLMYSPLLELPMVPDLALRRISAE